MQLNESRINWSVFNFTNNLNFMKFVINILLTKSLIKTTFSKDLKMIFMQSTQLGKRVVSIHKTLFKAIA